MEPTISTEEFQRFQSQLLDLREAQILEVERRLRAETRVKQLEDELNKAAKRSDTRGSDKSQLDELIKENNILRDKLLSTESAFQLQSSTLRAECHHLVTELSRLQTLANKPTESQSCQTLSCGRLLEVATQTDRIQLDDYSTEACSAQEVKELRLALESSNTAQDVYHISLLALQDKVSELENVMGQLSSQTHYQDRQLKQERDALRDQVNHLEQSITSLRETESTLRTQLESVRTRSEKVNRELRRQLARFVRNQPSESDQVSLRKSPSFSSSSSLSSCVNGNVATPSESVGTKLSSSDTSDQVPPGCFSMDDFKGLVNRMFEVQEDNCTLRRQVQLLQAQLGQRTASHLNGPHFTSGSATHPHTSYPITHPTPNAHQSSESTFSLTSVIKFPTFLSAPSSSSPDAVTLNQLKRMCEDLITQNIRLSDELDKLRGPK